MGIAACCLPLTGSTRDTVRLPPLTQSERNPTATPHGPCGTANVRITALLAGSIASTSSRLYEVTRTKPSPSASSHGLGIDSIRATARSLPSVPGDATAAGDAAALDGAELDGVFAFPVGVDAGVPPHAPMTTAMARGSTMDVRTPRSIARSFRRLTPVPRAG